MLKNVGFSPGPIDGNFGPLTEGAVIDFQRYVHITVDGIAGPQTYRALVKYGGLGGSTGGESGRQEVTPPPPTKEEIIAMRSSYFRSVAGVRQPYDVQNNVTVQSRYIYHQSTPSRYGFDFKAGYSLKKLPKWKKFRLPSSSFKRQAGSMALDFIPVVGNIKSGIEAIIGRDLVTERKLSVTDRLMAGVGIFTGGGGKALLKAAQKGFGFAANSLRYSNRLNESADAGNLLRVDLQFFASGKGGTKGTGKASKYVDVTKSGSRYANRATDVSKAQFEKNLLRDGWKKSISKDGKTIILTKDGAKYVLRDGAKSTGGSTADFYPKGSKRMTLKIRLK
ncbi:putative peptidoglycan binding protein [Tepidibacillus fermentans]|uniref:Putative peptidoglycan binding protein n=2 Tax=Tepidibacillus fermentans TaxID=1281767 RepID=A0A4R3KH00_9BACI|nr:putative peptidoglycan binding protein [Tepidibacillus fermentans]